ncbi:MAG: dephospho-CoA kinase [Candidatus Krumholzibacteriia bacterium]|jgi:dephospho-CoA kinase
MCSMKVWALTGPIGAGKSTASQFLASHGAAVVDGDSLGHQLLDRTAIKNAIVSRFGAACVTDGLVDRKALGALVFKDQEALASLNLIMHKPLVDLAIEKIDTIAKAGNHKLAVFEAAVYFRLPSPPPVDLVLVVTASDEVRSQRLVDRGLSLKEAQSRIIAQSDMQAKWQTADCTLVNNGSLQSLERQLLSLMNQQNLGSESAS